MYIYQADSVLRGAEIIHTYELRSKRGFMVETLYNWGLTGASLNASVIAVSNDTVKVAVDVDGGQKPNGFHILQFIRPRMGQAGIVCQKREIM